MSALLDLEIEEATDLPLKKYWTHEEYYRLHDMGLLKEPCELINGEIILKMPQNPPHIHLLFALVKWLRQAFGYDYVNSQVPVALDNVDAKPSDPEPDAVVVRQPVLNFYPLRVLAEDVVMVAEVSDTTLGYDRNTKADVYAAGGIAEYWVLDVISRRVYIYRNPSDKGYSLITILRENEEIAPLAAPDAKIRVGDLFPPAETQN